MHGVYLANLNIQWGADPPKGGRHDEKLNKKRESG